MPAEACLVLRDPALRVDEAALPDVLREPDERLSRDGALLWLRTLLLRVVDARDARDAGREASGLRRLDAELLSREGLREAPRFNVARPVLRLGVASRVVRLGLLRSVELERAARLPRSRLMLDRVLAP